MEISTALTLEIGQLRQPVVTSYQLGCLIFRLYQTKVYQGEKLTRLQKDVPERLEYNRVINTLIGNGVLQHSKDVSSHEVYTVLGQDTAAAEDIACCLDPFCYLSHPAQTRQGGLVVEFKRFLSKVFLHPLCSELSP